MVGGRPTRRARELFLRDRRADKTHTHMFISLVGAREHTAPHYTLFLSKECHDVENVFTSKDMLRVLEAGILTKFDIKNTHNFKVHVEAFFVLLVNYFCRFRWWQCQHNKFIIELSPQRQREMMRAKFGHEMQTTRKLKIYFIG